MKNKRKEKKIKEKLIWNFFSRPSSLPFFAAMEASQPSPVTVEVANVQSLSADFVATHVAPAFAALRPLPPPRRDIPRRCRLTTLLPPQARYSMKWPEGMHLWSLVLASLFGIVVVLDLMSLNVAMVWTMPLLSSWTCWTPTPSTSIGPHSLI